MCKLLQFKFYLMQIEGKVSPQVCAHVFVINQAFQTHVRISQAVQVVARLREVRSFLLVFCYNFKTRLKYSRNLQYRHVLFTIMPEKLVLPMTQQNTSLQSSVPQLPLMMTMQNLYTRKVFIFLNNHNFVLCFVRWMNTSPKSNQVTAVSIDCFINSRKYEIRGSCDIDVHFHDMENLYGWQQK